MKVGIYTNLTRDIEGRATKALVRLLKENGFSVYVSDELTELDLDVVYLDKTSLAETADLMVVFGGDGTILRIAKECAENALNIFAVNLGHMGFLAEVENVELKNIFDDIINGRYFIDERSMLEINVGDKYFTALNELVLERGTRTKIVKCEVSVNDSIIDRYTSDGIIVSSPTGSTAYSLSAGGPIVAPDVRAMIITPICAHSLNSRPVVISDKKTVKLKLIRTDSTAHISVDGEDVMNITPDQTITIRKSTLKVRFLRLKKYNYYEKLLGKMSYWSSFNKE